jgi:cytochrome b subunit of formate dehydrogenase
VSEVHTLHQHGITKLTSLYLLFTGIRFSSPLFMSIISIPRTIKPLFLKVKMIIVGYMGPGYHYLPYTRCTPVYRAEDDEE